MLLLIFAGASTEPPPEEPFYATGGGGVVRRQPRRGIDAMQRAELLAHMEIQAAAEQDLRDIQELIAALFAAEGIF